MTRMGICLGSRSILGQEYAAPAPIARKALQKNRLPPINGKQPTGKQFPLLQLGGLVTGAEVSGPAVLCHQDFS
jgi:hypothetical protein